MSLVHILLAYAMVFSKEVLMSGADLIKIKTITRPLQHAEGPHWQDEEQVLYFVDIAGHSVHKFIPESHIHTYVTLNNTVGSVIPVQGSRNDFVIGYGTDISILRWDGSPNNYSIKTLQTVDEDKKGNRFNDGKADLQGNLWIGTMGEEKPIGNVKMNRGSLFKFDTDCNLTKQISPVSISNGITWNQENNLMYYIDSPSKRVDLFDYDEVTAEISNRRVFFDFTKNDIPGVPDGMTIDNEDNLWIACWGGSKVIQVDGEKGKLLRSIELPVERITSVCFGGRDLTTLFVTTMRSGLNKSQLDQQPLAGSVFAIEGLGVTGTMASSAAFDCIA